MCNITNETEVENYNCYHLPCYPNVKAKDKKKSFIFSKEIYNLLR